MAAKPISPTPGSDLGVTRARLARVPLLLGAGFALAIGVWVGMVRAGARLPVPVDPGAHGPLMVAGFLATLIGLERATGPSAPLWVYAAPLFGVCGTVALLAGESSQIGILAYMASAFLLLAATIRLWWVHSAVYTAILCLGSVALYAGHLAWLAGAANGTVASLWMAFLVLTITGERLELSRVVAKPAWAHPGLLAILATYALSLLWGGWTLDWSARLLGLSLLGLSLWLLYFDLARRTIRHAGQPRFVAVALLTGFAWLGVAGAILLLHGATAAGPVYDAILHSVFVGFVFAMVFAHAPVIFPSILHIRMTFLPLFYLPLTVLELSVAARVLGDLAWLGWLRQTGVWGNVASLLLFLITAALAVRAAQTKSGQAAQRPLRQA